MPRNAIPALGLAAALVVLLAGCTGAGPAPIPTPPPSPPPASGDGILRLATLLPMTGESAAASAAMVAGVELAVREINEAGGVGGAPVEVLHRNSGADAAATEAAFDLLLERGIDVLLGPGGVAAEGAALDAALLPRAEDAGVVLISPSGADVPPESFAGGAEAAAAFAARVRSADPAVAVTGPAAQSYDAVILAALAATVATDDAGASLAFALPGVAAAGIPCHSWGECLDVLRTQDDIAYVGLSAPLVLSAPPAPASETPSPAPSASPSVSPGATPPAPPAVLVYGPYTFGEPPRPSPSPSAS